jgi:chemotaxis protein MotD
MTSLSLPSQSAALSPGATVAVGDHGAGKQRGAQDGSVFGALLGALDESAAPAQPANGNNAPAQSHPTAAPTIVEALQAGVTPAPTTAVHSLGSGVLVALDKRFSATTTQSDEASASEAPEASAQDGADASALTSLGWAALIMNATGIAPATASAVQGDPKDETAPEAKTATPTGAAKPTAKGAAAAGTPASANAEDAKIQVQMPSDASVTNALQPIALNAGTAPVDVKVVRSITYLGLDPTVHSAAGGQTPASASPRASASGVQGSTEGTSTLAPLPHASSGDGASTMSPDAQAKQQAPNGGKSGHAPNGASTAKEASQASAPASATATTPSIAEIGLSALSQSGMPSIGLGQLADVIASAAQSLSPQDNDATQSVKTSGTTSPASLAPVKELDVQLHPASLGALSIEMRLSNGNLTVTIKADKADTLKLIDSERSSISDKLKSLNFSVESLNVKALDATVSTGASNDASNSGTTGYGEAQQGQSGQSADGSSGNGRSLRGEGEQPRSRPQTGAALGEPRDDRNLGHRFV